MTAGPVDSLTRIAVRSAVQDAEIVAWAAYLASGSMKAAALELGVHEITIRKRIGALRDRYNVRTNAQLADLLARTGVR